MATRKIQRDRSFVVYLTYQQRSVRAGMRVLGRTRTSHTAMTTLAPPTTHRAMTSSLSSSASRPPVRAQRRGGGPGVLECLGLRGLFLSFPNTEY